MQRVDLKKRVRESFGALPKAWREAPVYLAVSAGMDSSVLAAVVLELRDRLPPLCFLHVNYGLRRPDCDREEALLRKWAGREGLPIEVLRLKPRGKPENLQAWARAQRFDFFRKTIKKRSKGRGTVWLAHHRRDQAETVLLRLLRGSGLRGLAGMKTQEEWEGLALFRPLLEVPHEALQLYAQNHRILFRRDRSNFTDLYLRNRVRRRILPLLRQENPSIEETLSLTAARAGQASEALEVLAGHWLKVRGRGKRLALENLRRQPPGLQACILEAWLKRRTGRSQSWSELLPRILAALAAGKSLELPLKGGLLKLGRRHLDWTGP
ncbi:MAG TPA: tRNA lysidine(34) synthetase TilS [bacterium]|nr:tRNA lysidine(34) synthetase TilS [bacterium]